MSEAKFTKGPWKVDDDTQCAILVLSNDGLVCDVSSSEEGGYLISEAPKLYKALEKTTEELAKLIEMYNAEVKDPCKFADGQTCHENAMLLAKARGEI